MKRTIIHIDEDKCDGCGLCIPSCHEGALQIIDNKARLISDLFCDGLGACVGHCPQDAITMIEREAEPYNETKVMEEMVSKGRNTILAHIAHLRDHNQHEFMNEAVEFIRKNNIDLSPGGTLDRPSVAAGTNSLQIPATARAPHHMRPEPGSKMSGGCPGMAMADFRKTEPVSPRESEGNTSELRQWPVQLHLLNPNAPYFKNADVVLAADCAAFAHGNFHQKFLRGKTLAIACPKLDQNQEVYLDKLISMIETANINTLTVVIMEVPCCGGLDRIARAAVSQSSKNIPLKRAIISIQGELLKEEWV
ncbi:MAG TPA: 4Fe-4S binding protein [Bacteroidales bacterium]|nr:4Fe-4S binding protein [Bacteroidales bacterium]